MLDREIRWLLDEKYGGNREAEGLAHDIARLEAGEPVAYVIGFVDFLGARIDLSERPLIPRPETEYWTRELIQELKKENSKAFSILDIFAGSGCIGIALLRQLETATVAFAEKEPRFIREIKNNLELNQIDSSRCRIIESDVFQYVDGVYDIIVANPPYGSELRKASVEGSVLKYEPHGAIFALDDGMEYIKQLIAEAPQYLKEDGRLYFEFDSPQYEDIQHFANKSVFSKKEFMKDQYGKWRWARFTRQPF